ncbi:Rrf2 family protein [Catalinimonas alkaloidigena]|uniref:RrF2 family transcriptional regulator n=1 Tax=Catalinimonas alkaloidigena TaxID=1075417 RepID=UPI0030B8CF09|nr:Rrf2 family protein [Catalinimonas alkaloidigena]
MFPKACEYGIRATIYVAEQSLDDKRVSLMAIAHEIGSPLAFTAKILQHLVKHKIMHSAMGPSGGFQIEKKQINQISLSQIVDAIDGNAM